MSLSLLSGPSCLSQVGCPLCAVFVLSYQPPPPITPPPRAVEDGEMASAGEG